MRDAEKSGVLPLRFAEYRGFSYVGLLKLMMKIRYFLFRLFLSLSMSAVAADFSATGHTEKVSVGRPVRQADGTMKMILSGTSAAPVVLQATVDFRSWNDLGTFTLSGNSIEFVDSDAPKSKTRYYRLKSTETAPPPTVQLSNLADSPNSVFVPAEGFDTIQYAPNGTLGFIYWHNRDLMLRERNTSGGWSQQTINSGGNLFQPNVNSQKLHPPADFTFQPAAILLYDSNSQPHVFKLNGDKSIAHLVRSGGTWTQQESIQNSQANNSLALLVGKAGPNNVFHLATITSGSSPQISYATTKNGTWSWTKIADIGIYAEMYLPFVYATRWFSLAVDSRNNAHMTYRPAFQISYHSGGYPRAYSELAYASNASGSWATRIVHKPADISGEAGMGASIAIGPDDQPRIASWYNERADTGSSQWSRLYYLQPDGSGNWTQSAVASRPDGYVAGDGEKGAGFAPYLRFDPQGRPHILFSDHAGEHGWTQTEFTGQIRHAYWNGSQWIIQRVFEQNSPLLQQMVHPAFALSGSEIAITGLERLTTWNWGIPPTVSSTYKHVFVTKPLP